jgi:CubicO group peptidase (beta-lactamase class C family)
MMSVAQGHVEPEFDAVREVFEGQFESGQNLGAGVAVYHRGKLVVDLWGGVADETSGRAWDRDTMVLCYSTTKGLTATCVHLLADRGLIKYEEPVATYWPEFAKNGKAKITVYHLLTHQAGLPLVPEGLSSKSMLDWGTAIRALEEERPIWEPGTDTGYHALTFGWLNGEVVRRVDGRNIGRFLREEICGPLGIDGMYIGTPADAEPRIATLKQQFEADPALLAMYEAAREAMGPDSLTARALAPRDAETGDLFNTPEAHQAEVPAANGIMTARDLARMYACLANYGELDGVRLMSEQTVRHASAVQTTRPDKVIVLPVAFSMGYMNGAPGWPQGDRATAFGHPGFGGSIGFADPEIEMSFGFVCNALNLGLTGAGRASSLADAARASIAALAA